MQQGHTGVIENGREEERKRQREQLPPCNLLCLDSSQSPGTMESALQPCWTRLEQ